MGFLRVGRKVRDRELMYSQDVKFKDVSDESGQVLKSAVGRVAVVEYPFSTFCGVWHIWQYLTPFAMCLPTPSGG